jgi:hypothetical protein
MRVIAAGVEDPRPLLDVGVELPIHPVTEPIEEGVDAEWIVGGVEYEGLIPPAIWYHIKILEAIEAYNMARCGSRAQGHVSSCKTLLMAVLLLRSTLSSV